MPNSRFEPIESLAETQAKLTSALLDATNELRRSTDAANGKMLILTRVLVVLTIVIVLLTAVLAWQAA